MEITEPVWWISVVVTGLLVNLTSAYLKPRIDAVFFAGSKKWRLRSAARNAEIEILAQDDDALTAARWKVGVLLWLASCSLAAPTLAAVLVALTSQLPMPFWMLTAARLFVLLCAATAFTFIGVTFDTVRKIGVADSLRRSKKRQPQP